MTKEQSDRLICEFMGVRPKYNSFSRKFDWTDGVLFMSSNVLYESTMNSIVSYVKYRTSWDWLMPVIEKIKSLGEITNVNYNLGGDFIIEGFTGKEILNIIINREDYLSDLDMCYFGCAEFVKWYNERNK